MEKVSVVLTVYNMESCLQRTLVSVAAQTYENLEIILIDDGSTDGSLAILEAFASADERAVLVTRPNKGQGASRNEGLEMATGDYVMLLDSDDIYDATMVAKMVARAQECDADVVVCRSAELNDATGKVRSMLWSTRMEWLPEDDPFTPLDMRDTLFMGFVGWPWDKLYRRSFLMEKGLRFPDLANSEDLVFVFLSLAWARSISLVDEELILHRVGRSGSVSNSRRKDPFAFYEATCLLKSELKKDPELFSALEWGFDNWAFDYCLWNIETMDDAEARAAMIRRLRDGGFPELGIDEHSQAYFGFVPDNVRRYFKLIGELGDGQSEDALPQLKHPGLEAPITFLEHSRRNGFRHALHKTSGKLFGQSSSARVKDARLKRGIAYFPKRRDGEDR